MEKENEKKIIEMIIQDKPIEEGQMVKIVNQNEKEFIGFAYVPNFFNKTMTISPNAKISLSFKKDSNSLSSVVAFTEKEIKEIYVLAPIEFDGEE